MTTLLPSTTVDTAAFRALLETRRADCREQRRLALAETATSLPDPVTVQRAAALARTLEEIDEALQRIAAGTYGLCVHCGDAIPVERLEFRPSAAGCVACQRTR